MSNIITAKNKLKVKFKNFDLLRQACEACIEAQIGTEISDAYKNKTKVDISIATTAVPRGIGFVRDGDEYVAKYDPFLVHKDVENLIDEISSNYQRLGYMLVLSKNRYSASEEVDERQGILVTGRQY
jgi:hypothetical protein